MSRLPGERSTCGMLKHNQDFEESVSAIRPQSRMQGCAGQSPITNATTCWALRTVDLVLRSPRRRDYPDCRCSSTPTGHSRIRLQAVVDEQVSVGGIGPVRPSEATVGDPFSISQAATFLLLGPTNSGGHTICMPTQAGALYLAVVLDAFSRRVVGWTMMAPAHDPCARGPGPGPKQRDPEETVQHYEQEYRSREHSHSETPRPPVAA